MLNDIIFIGGIHGVGKSTICKQVSSELNIEYLSASKLLKWQEVNEDSKNKKVKNIPEAQVRLIESLRNIVQENKSYLLDGHYCLLNEKSKVEKISIDIFAQMNLRGFCLIMGDINEIKSRLYYRDKKNYDYGLLEELQNCELNYAKQLSIALDVPLIVEVNTNYKSIKNNLRKIYTQH